DMISGHRSGRPARGALMTFCEAINVDRVAKSPIRDFSLHGKGKAWFSLSSRIADMISGHRSGRPARGALMTFCEAINVKHTTICCSLEKVSEPQDSNMVTDGFFDGFSFKKFASGFYPVLNKHC
ncbi:MAG: hypothetical protein RRA32_10705, partial [bacterium]|nr:hypothetical protein [bacterium]